MKPLRAGEADFGIPYAKPQRIVVGESYGHLEVLEELPKRLGQNDRRFRCRCHNVIDGNPCGAFTIKRTTQLTKPGAFRACTGCTEAHMKKTRNAWNAPMRRH